VTPPCAGLLLDLDDTLVDTRAAMVTAGRAAARVLWPEADGEVHAAVAAHFHGDPAGFFGRYARGELDFGTMRRTRLRHTIAELGLREPEDAHLRFEAVMRQAFSDMRVFEDVPGVLAWALAQDVPLGVLTNSPAHHTADKLDRAGLAAAFPVVATPESLGFGKPDARAFHHACERLGSPAQETAYVGDHLRVDALAARDAGLCGIWLRRGSASAEDDALAQESGIPVVASLAELPALLAGLGTVSRSPEDGPAEGVNPRRERWSGADLGTRGAAR
jgi:putative hydrolase of the HAD superfamily